MRYASLPPAPALSHARQAHETDTTCPQLSKYPAIVNLEKQVGVPKVYGVIGAATLYLFFIIFNLGGQLLTNLAGFVVPGYYSLQALFTADKSDDTQWLTVCKNRQALVSPACMLTISQYWVVFAFFTYAPRPEPPQS